MSLMHSIQAKIRGYRYRKYLPLLLELLSPKKDDVILDVGAGTGYIASKVSELCDEVYALEPNASKVEQIMKRFPTVKVFEGNAERIPFPESYFDKAYVVSAFHHFREQEIALDEIARILKPNGSLVIHESDPSRMSSAQKLESRVVKEGVGFLSPNQLKIIAQRHGLVTKAVMPVDSGYFLLATI